MTTNNNNSEAEITIHLSKLTEEQQYILFTQVLGAETPAPSPSVLVREFHETYGQPIRTIPVLDIPEKDMRLALVEEEAIEYREAVETDDLIELADALGDTVYVCFGAALTHGIDLDKVLAEIQRSNLSKLGIDGKPIYREDGKVLKGPNFFVPDIEKILKEQGWLG